MSPSRENSEQARAAAPADARADLPGTNWPRALCASAIIWTLAFGALSVFAGSTIAVMMWSMIGFGFGLLVSPAMAGTTLREPSLLRAAGVGLVTIAAASAAGALAGPALGFGAAVISYAIGCCAASFVALREGEQVISHACEHCGYSRDGLASRRCPECGHDFRDLL
jgi:hypothetical protein